MDILNKIAMMFGIAFAISMFVASIIWTLNKLVGNLASVKEINYPSFRELQRWSRIKKIRRKKIKLLSRKLEEKSPNALIDFYYGH